MNNSLNNELGKFAELQVKTYALQALLCSLLVRWIESSGKPEKAADDLLNDTLRSIAKFDLRGQHGPETETSARAIMEAFASDTVHAAIQSTRRRREGRR